MTPLFRCPWCVVVERGVRSPALMRKHIIEKHRKALLVAFAFIGTFTTHHVGDLPRNALKPHPPLNRRVSGEGDT